MEQLRLLHRVGDPNNSEFQQRSRVAFIVPTVPLVEQQARKIRTYLGGQYKVVGFSGGKNLNMNKRAFDILDSQIIIRQALISFGFHLRFQHPADVSEFVEKHR